MGSRLDLHTVLVNILGSSNVYFQPPENVRMQYPAIVYSRTNIETIHADDGVYKQSPAYEVTVIDANPDSEIPMYISQLPKCRHNRHFKSENLNHDVFTLYF